MIPCTEFIPAYSEFFKFLEARGGRQAVVAYWEFLSDEFLGDLRQLVKENGIRGCWIFWSRTLNEEAADFKMELDERKGTFVIEMQHCPSKGRLLECPYMQPYRDYCNHCDVLYRRVLEPLGYGYHIDQSECDRATCRIVITQPEGKDTQQDDNRK